MESRDVFIVEIDFWLLQDMVGESLNNLLGGYLGWSRLRDTIGGIGKLKDMFGISHLRGLSLIEGRG